MTNSLSGTVSHHLLPITVHAPAKVNLILRILDRRADGYHNLWSIMQTVALEDALQINLKSDSQQIQLQCDSEQLAADRSNLVYRAAAAVLDRAKMTVGLEIRLAKKIPMGAGLGGGSSDAAATILGLNHVLMLGWSTAQMADVGQPLGSDIPFFFYAPCASVSGRGETVRAVAIDGTRWAVLVNPGFGVETKWAYQQLATMRGSVRPLSPRHAGLERQRDVTWAQIIAAAENDFELPVFAQHGLLREIKETLLASGAEVALLSGSGVTVFGLFHDEATARRAGGQFSPQQNFKVFIVSTCSGPLAVR